MRYFEKLQPLGTETGRGDLLDTAAALRNIERVLPLGLPEALPSGLDASHIDFGTVAIICPGPSALKPEPGQTQSPIERLNKRLAQEDGLYVVLANAGYRLLSGGRLHSAHAFVGSLPDSSPADIIFGSGRSQEPDKNLTYYLSSMSPTGLPVGKPDVFTPLKEAGCDLRVFHAHLEGGYDFEKQGLNAVGTGTGAPVAAMALMAALGYRKFEFYGADVSCEYSIDLSDYKDMPAYLDRLQQGQMAVRVGHKTFTVTDQFWPQTLELLDFVRLYPEAVDEIYFQGDSINAAIFNDLDLAYLKAMKSNNAPFDRAALLHKLGVSILRDQDGPAPAPGF